MSISQSTEPSPALELTTLSQLADCHDQHHLGLHSLLLHHAGELLLADKTFLTLHLEMYERADLVKTGFVAIFM